MNNAEWMIKSGHKFSDLDAKYLELERGCEIMLNGKTLERVPIVNMVSAIFYWLDAEHKEPILDEAEKQYLSAVIRPFMDDVRDMIKIESIYRLPDDGKEYIKIRMNSGEEINFPYFRKGTMYKGMEVGLRYTLEELGL